MGARAASAEVDIVVDDIRGTITHPPVIGVAASGLARAQALKGMVEQDWGMALAFDKQATLAGRGVSQTALRRALGQWAGTLGTTTVLGISMGFGQNPHLGRGSDPDGSLKGEC